MIEFISITHTQYKNASNDLIIEYGCCSSPFGGCFLAVSKQGICTLAFFDTTLEENAIENEFHHEWYLSTRIKNETHIQILSEKIFTPKKDWKKPLRLLLKGSPFQLNVWETLLSLPENALQSYQEIAIQAKKPKAVRAVASAIAKNNIAYLIPCHRIIRKDGSIGQYRWNKHRKQTLIDWDLKS